MQPKWYTLKSKRKNGKKKDGQISGEVLMQFALADPYNSDANPSDILQKFMTIAAINTTPEDDDDDSDELARLESRDSDDDVDEDDEKDEDTSDETDDPNKPEIGEKRRKRLRLARLKRKSKARTYQYSGETDVVGIVFLEINKILDLPPERNSMLPHLVPSIDVCAVAHHIGSDKDFFRHGSVCGCVPG